jgi:nicotinamidase-related amidase
VSQFKPDTAALVLIDYQVGTMQLIKNIPSDLAKKNALALAKAARILGMPIVLTSSQEDRAQGPLTPELARLLPQEFARRIQRAGIVNAWDDPQFKGAIESTRRRQLVMAGVTTDVCLVYPAISAVRMERAGVVLTASNTLIAELARDWSTPQGAELIQLLFTDVVPPIHTAAD